MMYAKRMDVIIFKGITHIIIAVFIYYSLYGLNLINIAGVILGSLLPDIDIPYSILGRFNIFSYFMKHRGFTHTLIGMLIFTWIIRGMFENITSGFVFGYFLHLVADSLTPMGIMWLYPYKKDYYGVLGKKKKPSN